MYHAGGLVVGSSEIVNKAQLEYLCSKGAVVVIPNYRLSPQVTAKEAFKDCEEAHWWAMSSLPQLLKESHGIQIDNKRVAAAGHSVGGTLALHLASLNRGVKAVTAFYPNLYVSDPESAIYKPFTAPPFGNMPDFVPSEEDWAAIKPAGRQLSESGLATPGTIPPPRNKWQATLLKHGQLMQTVCPDGDYAIMDPIADLTGYSTPTSFIQGDADNIPGSGVQLVQKAGKDLRAAGVKDVRAHFVKGETHMFDLPPMVGTSDLGPRWEAVKMGLDFLFVYLKA